MKKTLIAFTMAIVLAGFGNLSIAADKKYVSSLFNSGCVDYDLGNYRAALKKLRKSVELADGLKYAPWERVIGYQALGEAERSMCLYEEAEKHFKTALKWAEQAHGKKVKQALGLLYNNMGSLYCDNSQFEKACEYWKKSEELKGVLHFIPVNNLFNLYITWGKYDLADEYEKEAYKVSRKGKYKADALAFYWFNKAWYATQKGNYAEAEKLYQKSLDYLGKTSTIGKGHYYYTSVLSQQADLYKKQSKFAEAEKIIRKCLKLRLEAFDEGNPRAAQSMVFLAKVLTEEGKYPEARQYIEKALSIYKKVFGDNDNSNTADAKVVFGNILRSEGKYDAADKELSEAIASAINVLGENNLAIASYKTELAKVKSDKGQYADADNLLQSASRIISTRTGPDHPERITIARALGYLHLKEGNYEKAASHYLNALEISKRVLGEESKDTADSARELGELYSKQNQYEKAIQYLNLAKTIDGKLFGVNSPQVASDLMALATAYDATGRSADATPLMEQATLIKEKVTGGAVAARTPSLKVPVSFDSSDNKAVREKWALVIGISNFKDSSINLRFAAKDATDFSKFLVKEENFKKDHVKLLTDENATRENIINSLGNGWLGNLAHKDDLILVYVSSHGSRSQEKAGGINFLVAHDTDKHSLLATGIPMQWFSKMIKDQVQSDRVVLILDVCHSGAAAQGGKALNRILGMNPNQLKIGSGQMVLCSSMAEQVSWESKKYENSVFTRRLIESLRVNKDKTTLLEAYKRLKVLVESEVLRDRSNLQTPVIWNKDWSGKDPVLAVKTETDATSVD